MTEIENNQTEEVNNENNAEQESVAASNSSSSPVFHLDGIFSKRFVATIIDSVLIGVATIILSVIGHILPDTKLIHLSSLWSSLVFVAAGIVFMAKDGPIQFAGLNGQTPGKKVMGIRVTDLEKKPISFAISMKRNLVLAIPYFLSAIIALLGVISIPLISSLVTLFLFATSSLVGFIIYAYEIFMIYSGERHRRSGDVSANTIVSWE